MSQPAPIVPPPWKASRWDKTLPNGYTLRVTHNAADAGWDLYEVAPDGTERFLDVCNGPEQAFRWADQSA